VCIGEASSAEEADQQSSERSVATLLTGTGPSWELHGPRVARRLRHRTRCHNTTIRLTRITAIDSVLHCHLSCFCSRHEWCSAPSGSSGGNSGGDTMHDFDSAACWCRQSGSGGEGPEAMDKVEVVILRFSLAICNPGCLHLVLESVSPKAPYLLENRTAHPFQYRQAGLGETKPAFHMAYNDCFGAFQITFGNLCRFFLNSVLTSTLMHTDCCWMAVVSFIRMEALY